MFCFDYLDGLEGGNHFARAKWFVASTALLQKSLRPSRQLIIAERGVYAVVGNTIVRVWQ